MFAIDYRLMANDAACDGFVPCGGCRRLMEARGIEPDLLNAIQRSPN